MFGMNTFCETNAPRVLGKFVVCNGTTLELVRDFHQESTIEEKGMTGITDLEHRCYLV